jgi:hypothetical protein
MLDSLRAFQSDNDGFGSQSLRTAGNHQCLLVMNMSAVATPNHDRLVASARHPYNLHVRPFNSEPQSRRGINNGPKPLKRAFVVGWLRRFSHVIAITAAAITSAAAVDLPEISLMNTLLLWDEGGIAFGDLTFWNRPLLGTATAIVVDCQFLDRDRQKVDQRKLTVEGPVYGRTIKTVRVRIGTLSENAKTMACSVVDFKWVSWQQ